jgi:hypothetical protein
MAGRECRNVRTNLALNVPLRQTEGENIRRQGVCQTSTTADGYLTCRSPFTKCREWRGGYILLNNDEKPVLGSTKTGKGPFLRKST